MADLSSYINIRANAVTTTSANSVVSTTGNINAGNITATGFISAAGNITGNYFIGNGSQLTGITGASNYSNANVTSFLGAYGSNTISTSGNITAGNLIGNISVTNSVTGTLSNVTLVASGKSWVFDNTGNLTVPTAGNILLSNAQSTISSAGNIIGNYFIGNGSQLTGITTNYGNANVANYLPTFSGNLTSGNVSATGNITTANYFVGNLVGTTASLSGNITASNLTLSGQTVQLTGAVNPGYMNVGLTTSINTVGAGSVLIYDAILKNNGTAVTYNTSTGVFTLTAGVTYNLMATGSWQAFSDTANGYIIYAWVDATTGTRLDTTGDSDGVAEPLNRNVNEFNATAAELIYTPVTNQTVKVAVVANTGTATLRGGIGSKAIVTQINPTVSLGAVSTISATGSITAGGGLNITGNIVGTSPNVSLIAGSYTYTFDNTGNITLPTGGDLVFSGNTSLTSISNGNITIDPNGTGQLVVTAITPASFGNTLSVAGTVTSNGTTNGTAFAVGNGAVSNVALGFFPTGNTAGNYAIRDYSTANSIMYFDTTIGSANIGGSFVFRGSNAFTTYATINQYGAVQPTKPGFRVYGNGVTTPLSTTQNGNGVLNGNNWAVDYNQGSYLNSTTGVFTAPVTGLYATSLVARVANNTAPSAQICIVKNYANAGGTVQAMWESGTNCTTNHFGVSSISKLNAGDTLVIKVTLAQLTFDANDNWSVAFLG